MDTIIVRQLKAIECEIEEEKTSLKELDMNDMINCASRCLHLIRNSTDDTKTDSYSTIDSNSNMATKYKVANELSNQINSLGFKTGSKSLMTDAKDGHGSDGLGYQTFLYGSHSEFRNLFLFLISKLPKASGQEVSMTRTFNDVLKDRIKDQVADHDVWLPFMTGDAEMCPQQQFKDCDRISHLLWNQKWPEFTIQDTKMKLSSVEVRKEELNQGSSQELIVEPKEEEQLELCLKSAEEKLKSKQEFIQGKVLSLNQSNNVLKSEQMQLIELKHADRSIESLEGAVEILNQDLETLKQKWTELETELISEKDAIVSFIKSKSSESDLIKEQLTVIKSEIKNNLTEVAQKEEWLETVQIPSKSVPTRKSYTKRIIEIINNYKKQLDQTKKILSDIKGHQKEINSLTGKVSRSFAICDDTIFKSGDKLERIDSEFYRKSYKLLANLHDTNSAILTGLEVIGSIRRDILKTEQLIEKEESEKIDEKLTKITHDLAAIKALNNELMSRNK